MRFMFIAAGNCYRIETQNNKQGKAFMTDKEQVQATTEEAKQAQMKRAIGVVVIGVAALTIFYFLASGVTSLMMADTVEAQAERMAVSPQPVE